MEQKTKLIKEFADTVQFLTKNFDLGVGYLNQEYFTLMKSGIKDLEKVIDGLEKVCQKERLSDAGIKLQ